MDVIEVKDFHKSFGSKVVHRGVNLSVRKGECMGLVGGSGCGKSVILRSLIGLEKPDRGSIKINGIEITGFNENQLVDIRCKAAYVFQGGALFDSMSVEDNLAYPLREHTKLNDKQIQEKVLQTLKKFGLQGSEKLMPASLSGGMQKRVGLARAIILGPEIILYDEPTAGLDPYNTKKIQQTILELKKTGTTSILVTHDMPTAFEVCDRMALLLDGRVAAEGTKDELKAGEAADHLNRFVNGEAT
ncbi:MAG: ABC transporter ATP-binding protein [Oligoflexia bacterium]|nr:ABC transporter ATP-binding protein [Oligoflexia bacterium]